MYSSEKNSSFDWKDIITKIIFLTLFIFMILWLFRKIPNMNVFYSNVFRENLKYMQDSAKEYYTNERLPKNVGDVSEMTLQDMIDKSLILPFSDKNGKPCDTKESYVQIKKEKNEYILKVNLVCDDESNYIKETLGCHDYCNGCDETPTDPEKVVEYEYKQAVKTSKLVYSCPENYKLNNGKCYKTTTSSKVKATVNYSGGQKVVVQAKKKENNDNKVYAEKIKKKVTEKQYSCLSGEPYSGTGSSLVCKIPVSKICNYGNVNGSDCTYSSVPSISTKIEYIKVPTIKYNTGNITYKYIEMVPDPECNSNDCPKIYYSYKKTTTTTGYTCPKGGYVSGSKCIIAGAAKCPTGSKEIDGKCYKNGTIQIKSVDTYSYTCPYGYKPEEGTSNESLKCYKVVNTANDYYCENPTANYNSCNHTCTYYTDDTVKSYKCPKDYFRDGEYCYKTNTTIVSATTTTKQETIYNYKWSTEKQLMGWIATGNTREISK